MVQFTISSNLAVAATGDVLEREWGCIGIQKAREYKHRLDGPVNVGFGLDGFE